MTRKVRPDALARVVAETYAKSANAEMTNQDLFEGLADAGVVPREALRKMTPVGKSGAKHCLAQRQLRWAHQNLARAQLLERDPKTLIPPLYGALLKNEQDVHLFERVAFMAKGRR